MGAVSEGKLLASTRRNPAFNLLAVGIRTYWKEATTAFKRHMIKPVSAWRREANEALIMLP